MKIVINSDYGGFGLSDEALELYANKKSKSADDIYFFDIPRDDPDLIEIVEHLGQKSNDSYAELKIVEIPDDVKWMICEYDGSEWVAEEHRTWS